MENILTHNCKFQECQCSSIHLYGGYCKKHKNNYLMKDNLILMDHFTCNIKDYSLKDLKYFYIRNISHKKHSKFKKGDFFKAICNLYSSNNLHIANISKIIRLQSYIRKKLILSKIKYQGLAVLNRNLCNNDEDFYTYESKNDIESKFFFSYKDLNNNYWCFDIRSLKKLIDMNYTNPYTTEEIPDCIKDNVNRYVNYLIKQKVKITIDNTIVADRKTMVKQKFVDIFSQIELSGYSCDISWVMNLNIPKIKKLYRELEDIWNYRANLSIEVKKKIVPPDGRLFVMPVNDYLNCNVLVELQEILANELIKILSSEHSSDMNLGFMYFIIGLSMVSRPCFMIHQSWVQYVF